MNQTGPECSIINEVGHSDGIARVTVTGDLVAPVVPDVKKALDRLIHDREPKTLILDLAGVPFMDSAGMAALVFARRRVAPDSRVILLNPITLVRELMKIARIDSLFVIETSKPDEPLASG